MKKVSYYLTWYSCYFVRSWCEFPWFRMIFGFPDPFPYSHSVQLLCLRVNCTFVLCTLTVCNLFCLREDCTDTVWNIIPRPRTSGQTKFTKVPRLYKISPFHNSHIRGQLVQKTWRNLPNQMFNLNVLKNKSCYMNFEHNSYFYVLSSCSMTRVS